MKILEGQKYKCIASYVMDNGDVACKKGKVYVSNSDNCMGTLISKDHCFKDEESFNLHFELIEKDTKTPPTNLQKSTQEYTNTQPHYDNSNGSLYLFSEQQKLNAWEFDILKRIVRCRKKGQFKEDLEKTIEVIKLYLKEYDNR